MSKAFRDHIKDNPLTTPKDFCKVPGAPRDENGKILYVTDQAPKDRCDVNKIIERYARTGMIDHVAKIDAQYGDLTQVDYKTMIDRVITLQAKFMEIPARIREKFDNNPAKMLDFLDDPKNKDEALRLGIVRSDWDYSQLNRDTKNKETTEGDTEPPAP